MSDDVKGRTAAPPRRYDASGRLEKAQTTRRLVIAAAQALLEAHGYTATTIVDIARQAGVSPESIYKSFGSKAELVKAVFDVVIGGDDQSVPVAERPETRRIIDEPDVRAKLHLYAEGAAIRQERSAGIQLALRNGAASDPALAELWGRIQAERLAGTAAFARHLIDSGQLRDDITVEEVRDMLWVSISIEVYDLFVIQRSWTPAAYADWLQRTLVGSFVAPL